VSADQFRCDVDDARQVLTVHGELDEPATVELRETIGKASADLTTTVAVDLTDVTFMPSPAIGVLATSQAAARRNGADVVLVAPEGTIAQRLLTICALEHVESLT
jgi:anti-anti-sigma factor